MEILNLHSNMRGSWNLLKWVGQVSSSQCQGRPLAPRLLLWSFHRREYQEPANWSLRWICWKELGDGEGSVKFASLAKWWFTFFLSLRTPLWQICVLGEWREKCVPELGYWKPGSIWGVRLAWVLQVRKHSSLIIWRTFTFLARSCMREKSSASLLQMR